MLAQQETKKRWQEEAAFFDRTMEQQVVKPLDPLVVRRYSSSSPRKRFREEFRFKILGNLEGRRILDVGCGDGTNSVLLAALGAQVTGIDISPKSIEVAKRKAEMSGVSANASFMCSPLEEAVFAQHTFDVVWGDCILHHLISNLQPLMTQLSYWAKPGGLMLFMEPVNFNNTLRRLRLKIPVKTDATPDERPLEPAELEIVNRFLPDMEMRFYSLLGRLERFVLFEQFNYEHSSLSRRVTANGLALADYAMLSMPILRNMGGYAVFYGHVPGADPASC